MSAWDEFLAKVETGVARAATGALAGFVAEAKSDAQTFLTAVAQDLKTWTAELAAGQIDAGDLMDFLAADEALAEMAALTEAGIAAADIQRFRDTLVNTVVSAAVATFKLP